MNLSSHTFFLSILIRFRKTTARAKFKKITFHDKLGILQINRHQTLFKDSNISYSAFYIVYRIEKNHKEDHACYNKINISLRTRSSITHFQQHDYVLIVSASIYDICCRENIKITVCVGNN